MNRRLLSDRLWSAGGLIAFFGLWEVIARMGVVSVSLLPPSVLPGKLISEISLGIWQKMVLESLTHYLGGLVLGSFLGIVVGMAAALYPTFNAVQAWLARVLRPIPPLAWIPFAIIWFGITQTSAAFVIAIGIFWINYFTAYSATRAVDQDLIELAVAFGHPTLWARLRKVILPAAAPGLLSGLRAGIGQGWMTVVAAELFGIPGIGQRMMEAAGLLATPVVLVYMFTIAALYGLSDMLFITVQNRILRWQR